MEQRFGFGYKMTTVTNINDGKALPVSRGLVGSATHRYITVPVNAVDEDPADPGNTVSLANGWTFLYGPTLGADVFAFVRLKRAQSGCSNHLRLYIVDGTGARTPWVCESPERFVGENETHLEADGSTSYSSTHLDGAWHVPPLAADERLRLEVDYWNASAEPYLTARIVGARITGTYWRPTPAEG